MLERLVGSTPVEGFVLSNEQLRKFGEDGALVVRGALDGALVSQLDAMARAAEALPPPALVHHERVAGAAAPVICRVENYCAPMADSWGAIARSTVGGMVSQLYGEPAVLFKDKINFKMPGGGGFLCHQDATACVVGFGVVPRPAEPSPSSRSIAPPPPPPLSAAPHASRYRRVAVEPLILQVRDRRPCVAP